MSMARREIDFMPPSAVERWQRTALIVGVLGTIGAIIGWIVNTERFYQSFLLGYMLCIGATLGCLAVLMVYHLTGGKWGTVARRILEAGTRTMPLMIVLFIPILVGLRHLYPWARPELVAVDEHLQHIGHSYLRPSLFIVRAVIYFAIWSLLIYWLNKISDRQDRPPLESFDVRLRRISGPGEVLYAFTITFAAVDWVMSIDPHWMSTIFGLLFIAGHGLTALCLVVVIGSLLVRHSPMKHAWQPEQFHDQGKLLLAFTMLWGWFSLSQWLIIWSGNLPEEISWYLNRTRGGWEYWGSALLVVQFAIPFALLLSRDLKMNWRTLRWIALLLIVARYFDLYFFVMPSFEGLEAHFRYNWLDVVVPAGIGGLWLAYFFWNLKRRPLLALYDDHVTVLLAEEKEHEHV
ncbi:MAG TPA: hypothetical protein VD837_12700 [Terriglobales bacterium]|nr:hypothetical protein [Terriglobales bacterium]